MNTRSLEVFITVANYQSVSLAAERHHLTQSAVSKRIAQLESELNTALFERHNRRLSLTYAGSVLLNRAQEMIDLLNNTQQELQDLNNDIAGKLCIAASHHIGLHRLPPTLQVFKKKHPNVELDLQFMGSEQAAVALEQRQVDFALATLEKRPKDLFEQKTLWHDKLIPVCSHQHPLAELNQPNLQDFCKHTAILPEQNTTTFNLINDVFLKQSLSLKLAMSTNYLETIKMMVSVGLGWSALPESMIDDEKLKRLNWPVQTPSRALGIMKLPNRNLSRTAEAFIQRLENS